MGGWFDHHVRVRFAETLAEWIGRQEHWRPNVRRFSLQLVPELRRRPVTRDLDWGVRIPVPGYEERNDKRVYVWFDAVVGYLSASIEWAANSERNAASSPASRRNVPVRRSSSMRVLTRALSRPASSNKSRSKLLAS